MTNGRLSKESRNKIRKVIIDQLKEIPDGERIKLDVKLLDDLIFFKYYNEELNQQIKIPIWTGEFLRKIDLRELSFENAIIDGFVQDNGQEKKYIDCILRDYIDEYSIKKYIEEYKECNDEELIKSCYTSDFSYTNIIPDFSKSTRNDIQWCNFEGVDLSNSNDDGFSYCNLNNTNIRIDKYDADYSYLYCCNISNNDFSNITLDARDIIDEDAIFNCNFANTKLNITYKFDLDKNSKKTYEEKEKIKEPEGTEERNNRIRKLREMYGSEFHHEDELYYAENLKELIEIGYLDGCYLNGKLIDSKRYERDLIKEITSSIEEQKNNFKK